jgi:hypothetical protein
MDFQQGHQSLPKLGSQRCSPRGPFSFDPLSFADDNGSTIEIRIGDLDLDQFTAAGPCVRREKDKWANPTVDGGLPNIIDELGELLNRKIEAFPQFALLVTCEPPLGYSPLDLRASLERRLLVALGIA